QRRRTSSTLSRDAARASHIFSLVLSLTCEALHTICRCARTADDGSMIRATVGCAGAMLIEPIHILDQAGRPPTEKMKGRRHGLPFFSQARRFSQVRVVRGRSRKGRA